MQRKKKKILINWDYKRVDLLAPLVKFSDEIDFVFIYFKNKVEDPGNNNSLNCIYWDQYTSPYKILKEIRPDKVVFCDIESFHQIALNIACKNSGIKTFHLEHGIKDPKEISLAYNDFAKDATIFRSTKIPALSTFFFLLMSVRTRNIKDIFDLVKFIYYRRKFGIQVGLHKSIFELRRADFYINFTRENALRLIERDGIREEQLILIGNPVFDPIFENHENTVYIEKDYYLLIDTPLAEDPGINFSYDSVNGFYEKLNIFCLKNNAELYIKLHPKSYVSLTRNFFLSHPNIKYFTHAPDLTKIIFEAKGCFGFFSGLLVPVIYFKKCILFETGIQTTQRDWEELGMVKNLNFFSFVPGDINFYEMSKELRRVNEYISKYLFKADSKATQRLKEILIS